MDNAPGAGPAGDAGGDWRTRLQPEARRRIVNKIMETLKKHLPVTVPEGLSELEKIAVRFEDKIYTAATDQSDYLRKISLKMLSMDGHSRANAQQNPQNAQVVQNQRYLEMENQSVSGALSGSTSRTSHPGAGASKEELYQMNKALKDQYLEGISDLYEISKKLPVVNHMTPQEPTNKHEEVKSFKSMMERSLHSLEINKSRVQPSLEESIPMYKRQITSIVDSEEWTPEKKFQQSSGQAPSSSSSETQQAPGTLSPERSNVKRLRPFLNDGIHN
ncbi:hypothetical protein EJB05_47203 [Eragrostis curvula]|uniref:Mediator complex subunit 15 KIX domain-containing protein n=1 Tax=Eragrostis curvula TaxID=38414 RepID=A0A5J9T9A4_9POAL|nr:hypothetical protein EJB05_47181 [Eragrostis curvula]TVU07161.1 hypothetical protein EJB05_47203 [Eragrostis curvula]